MTFCFSFFSLIFIDICVPTFAVHCTCGGRDPAELFPMFANRRLPTDSNCWAWEIFLKVMLNRNPNLIKVNEKYFFLNSKIKSNGRVI